MSLYQLCYRSHIKPHVFLGDIDAEIDRTTKRVRHMNALNGVTGALILTDAYAFHLIEGQPERVQSSLECARRDPRHDELSVLSRRSVEYRLFHDTWLHFADLRLDHGRELPGNLAVMMPRPESATGADILELMAHVACDLTEAQLTNRLLRI